MSTDLQLSFAPGEYLPTGTRIAITGAENVDARSAQSSVYLSGPRGRVDVLVETDSARGSISIPTDGLAPGAYTLVIHELTDADGNVFPSLVSRFVLANFVGTPPENSRVEHLARLYVGELDLEPLSPLDPVVPGRGQYLEMMKAVDRANDSVEELAFDAEGGRVDPREVLTALAERRFERFGRMPETLARRLDSLEPGGTIDVVVVPRLDDVTADFEKPAEGEVTEPPREQREQDAAALELAERLLDVVASAGGEVTARPVESWPAIHATMTADAVRELSRHEEVGVILLDERDEILDLGTSISVARTDQAHVLGFTGDGVNVAVFESGPRDTTDLVFTDRFTTNPGASDHARLTSAIIRNAQAGSPNGHAPDCNLHSANSSSNDALRWAANEGCTVISQSFHRGSEPGGAGLQSDDLLKDWLALRWPYPTIVQAAGNFWATDPDDIDPPQDEYVNHKGYNTLAVGNHNDTAGAMSGSSVFRNPASPHGDRELPEICANGTTVTAVGESMSGTSFAAPAVAGVTALVQEVDGTLRSWPEGCRAILLASATRNVSDRTWWTDVAARRDVRDGAGAVDAEAAVRVAQSRRRKDAPGARRGWDVGTLSSAHFDHGLSTFRYRVAVPRGLLFASVKVALAWDSKITRLTLPWFPTFTFSTLTVDFDLTVRDSNGHVVATSASWDNSYEIAEFEARGGSTYDIRIRRWSGTDSVWYGLAWNVEGFSIFDAISALDPLGF